MHSRLKWRDKLNILLESKEPSKYSLVAYLHLLLYFITYDLILIGVTWWREYNPRTIDYRITLISSSPRLPPAVPSANAGARVSPWRRNTAAAGDVTQVSSPLRLLPPSTRIGCLEGSGSGRAPARRVPFRVLRAWQGLLRRARRIASLMAAADRKSGMARFVAEPFSMEYWRDGFFARRSSARMPFCSSAHVHEHNCANER